MVKPSSTHKEGTINKMIKKTTLILSTAFAMTTLSGCDLSRAYYGDKNGNDVYSTTYLTEMEDELVEQLANGAVEGSKQIEKLPKNITQSPD